MTSSRAIIAWRRALLAGITALIALLAISFTEPTSAHAIVSSTTVPSGHVGWVTVRGGPWVCPTVRTCTRQPSVAWSWNGRSWSQASLQGGTSVYAYPYSGSWHWAWTQRTGWLAIQTSSLQRAATRCGVGYAVPCPVN